MADASALGIHPPNTVRIDMGDWQQDWPYEQVELFGDRVEIHGPRATLSDGLVCSAVLVRYEYEHARACCTAHATGRFFPPIEHPVAWIFHGREDFTVTAGPPQAPSVN